MATRRERLLELLCAGLHERDGIKVRRNGADQRSAPPLLDEMLANTLSVALRGVDAAALLAAVDGRVCASAGAACHAGTVSVSRTLGAIGCDEADARGTLRLSLGRQTTDDDVERAAAILVDEALKQVRLRNNDK